MYRINITHVDETTFYYCVLTQSVNDLFKIL